MAATELFSTSLFNDANLVSYYREESNGNDAKGTNNLTDANMTYAAAQFNNGGSFNGSSSTQSTTTIFTGSSGTINLWIKSSDGNGGAFFQQSNSANANYLKLGQGIVTAVTDLGFDVSVAGVQVLTFGTNVTGWNDAAWHMLTITVDSGGNKFYIDGTQNTNLTYANGTSATQKWFADLTGADNVYLGAGHYNGTTSSFYNGMLDDIAIFSRALTAAEVSSLYTGIFPSKTRSHFALMGVA